MQLLSGFAAAREAIIKANEARAFGANPKVELAVQDICAAVRQEGDAAVLRYERQFDCPTLEIEQFRVGEAEIDAAWRGLPADAQRALERAARNIAEFHARQPRGDWTATSTDGVLLGQRYTPIDRVGLYAPYGRAVYPSTVLMLAMPAKVAGVPEIVLATPPGRDGLAHPVIVAAARIAGIREIYKIGGAVAMAALAYGTATIAKVDKLVGPGNSYVTLAKKHLYGQVGIDGLYGPSEVVVLAHLTDNAPQLAADLIAQAEHGPDSFVCLIVTDRSLADAVLGEIETQTNSSNRAAILRESLTGSLALCVESLDEACRLSDLAAAEHVEIWGPQAAAISEKLRHAGAIFLNTPVPLGDYIAGPSHTLPTGVSARYAHGVGVDTFLKRTSLISAPPSAIAALADDLAIIAELEELPGHAEAVRRSAT